MNCPNCNGVIPMVGWNDKEFFENCPWCGVALQIEEESTDEESADGLRLLMPPPPADESLFAGLPTWHHNG